MRYLMLVGTLVALVGCNGYRPISLPDHVELVKNKQEFSIQETKDAFNGNIDEDNAIRLALAFNPEIRTPIIRNRGWGDDEVRLRGLARPELDVDSDEVTLGLNVDMFGLYNLLSSSERAAWKEMRRAERKQAHADATGAVVRLKRDVRLAFLELARLDKKLSIYESYTGYISDYPIEKIEKIDTLALTTFKAEIKQKIEETILERDSVKLSIMKLLGIEPNKEIQFDTSKTLNVSAMPELQTIQEMEGSIKEHNWQLISLYSQYIRKEYELRQVYLRRWGEVSVGPSFTVTKDEETSVGISLRVRIPWPSHSADNVRDITDERAIAAARYTAVLHELHSDITKQYNIMLMKWESIKNPKVSTEWYKNILVDESKNINAHYFMDITEKLCNQDIHQLDEVSKYKMAGIILESIIK